MNLPSLWWQSLGRLACEWESLCCVWRCLGVKPDETKIEHPKLVDLVHRCNTTNTHKCVISEFYSIPQGTAVCVCGLRPISQRSISFLWFNLIFIYLIIYFFVETVIGCSEYQEVREPTSHASSLSYISHHPNISSPSSINRTDSVFSHFLYLFLILSLYLYLAPSLSFPPFFFLSVYDHFSSNCSPVRKPSYPFIYFFHVLSHF